MRTKFFSAIFLVAAFPVNGQASEDADAEALRIHCPEASSIVQTTIPWSIHSVFTAKTDEGYAFGTFGIAYGDPTSMGFFRAEISEVNDYWRYTCVYEKNGAGLALSTRDDPGYKDCHFADGTQQCRGSIEECVLICPPASIPVDDEQP